MTLLINESFHSNVDRTIGVTSGQPARRLRRSSDQEVFLFLSSVWSVYLHIIYYFFYTHFISYGNFLFNCPIIVQRLENDLKCQSEKPRDFSVTTSSTLKVRSIQEKKHRESNPKIGSCRSTKQEGRHLSSKEQLDGTEEIKSSQTLKRGSESGGSTWDRMWEELKDILKECLKLLSPRV